MNAAIISKIDMTQSVESEKEVWIDRADQVFREVDEFHVGVVLEEHEGEGLDAVVVCADPFQLGEVLEGMLLDRFDVDCREF
jgi:hypothetical protein